MSTECYLFIWFCIENTYDCVDNEYITTECIYEYVSAHKRMHACICINTQWYIVYNVCYKRLYTSYSRASFSLFDHHIDCFPTVALYQREVNFCKYVQQINIIIIIILLALALRITLRCVLVTESNPGHLYYWLWFRSSLGSPYIIQH